MATKSHSCRPSAADDAVLVTESPLSLEAAVRRVQSPESGALAVFLGVVRGIERGRPILSITYEAYQGMADRQLCKIARQAGERWNSEVAVSHRTGRVPVGESSLVVACSSAHRREAFEACRFVVDQIKARVMIWKVEYEWVN